MLSSQLDAQRKVKAPFGFALPLEPLAALDVPLGLRLHWRLNRMRTVLLENQSNPPIVACRQRISNAFQNMNDWELLPLFGGNSGV